MISYLLAVFCLLAMAAAKPIKNLPDYSGPPLSMYSGYIEVNATNDRNIFYWLIEAEENADKAPLFVWFQGGPGCSGLGGMFTENGPLQFDNGKLGYRSLGWTKFANMLYIEQPACVGFSYTTDCLKNNKTGDDQAASDNYNFLKKFLDLPEFTKYQGRDTWFGGESYGGVYVPMLTNLVLSDSSTQIYKQFAGFAIGNPVMSCQGGFIGTTGAYNVETFNLLYWHGLVSYSNWANWTKYDCNSAVHAGNPSCEYILAKATNQIGVIDQAFRKRGPSADKNWPSLDPDDLYFDFCLGNGTLEFSAETNTPGTCNPVGKQVADYLNRADVQAAIGAKKPASAWAECANIDYTISGDNMVKLYDNFPTQKPGVKIMVYSGDVDILTVPFAYTAPCFEQMSSKGKLLSDWQPWFVNYATAGYWEQWEKYTWATLKGAGHEAPEFEPLNAFNMISRFINAGKLDDPDSDTVGTHVPDRVTQSSILRKLGLAKKLPWMN